MEPVRSNSLIARILRAKPWHLTIASVVLLLLACFFDTFSGLDVSLGVLYVFPIFPGAVVWGRWSLIAFSVCASMLRISLGSFDSNLDAGLRLFLSIFANAGTGLFISELVRNRRLAIEHMQAIEKQQSLRRELEEHLRALAESSPAAIFTLDEHGRMLSGNRATRTLLGIDPVGYLTGLAINPHLPVLADALLLDTGSEFLRTAAQCQGRRLDGTLFFAQIWFSTYLTPQGRRLAAIAVDCSEETREREEQSLRQILDNNRVIAAAVAHEIRNVCSAITLIYSNLARTLADSANEDFRALGHLVQALEKISATELQSKTKPTLSPLDPREVLNHLRIIIEPAWRDVDGVVRWNVPERLPLVFADEFGLTQAFLNLSQNSLRAVADCDKRELTISVAADNNGGLRILLQDSGPGIRDNQHLFEPFQDGAEHVGLGLYVSRAILRSFGGDLRHEPTALGCRFVAELRTAAAKGVQAA